MAPSTQFKNQIYSHATIGLLFKVGGFVPMDLRMYGVHNDILRSHEIQHLPLRTRTKVITVFGNIS